MKKQLLSALSFLMLCMGLQAQTNIANYTLAKSVGTYVPLSTGATTLFTSWDNNVSASIPLGGSFTFGAVTHTACYISSNGFITFGGAPSSSNYTPLSAGTYSGAISAFGQDGKSSMVVGSSPSISYANVGSEFVVQFTDHANYYGRTSERLNFQIRLNLTNNVVNIVYGTFTSPGSSSLGTAIDAGIRGSSTTWASNVNNLTTADVPSGTSCNWSNAVNSSSNSTQMLFSSSNNAIVPSNGLTFTWAPPVNVALAPVRTFSVVTNITLTSADVTWTAPTAASQYSVQYRIPGSCSWTNFAGNPVTTNSASLSGLTQSTNYQVRVQSTDGTNTAIWSHIPDAAGTGNGYTTAGTFKTLDPPCVSPTSQPTGLVFGGVTNAAISGTFTAATPTVSNYLVIRTLGTAPNTPTNGVTYTTGSSAALGGTVVSVGTGTAFALSSGIAGNTNYTYFIYSFSNTGCLGGPLYNIISPLMATVTTCPAKVTGLTTSSVTASSFNLAWTAPAGGSAAVINYSIEISSSSTFTTGNVAGSPFMVSAPTASLMVTGLNPVAVYYYRVTADNGCNGGATTSANVTTAAIPVDLQTLSLITPAVNATGCYATAPIVVQIKNAGTSALDFATNNASVYGAITGTNPQTFTTVVSTGTLAANATMNVTLTTTYNMSAAGVYSINAASMLATPDANTANDVMAQVTRTATAATPLPYSQDFPTTTAPAGWNTTGWIIGAGGHGLTTNGIFANLDGSGDPGPFDLLKLGTVVGNESFAFDYRVLNYTSYPTGGVPTGAWGNFKVQVSSDCGTTFADLATIDNTTHTVTTQAWTNKAYSLSAFAGQNIIVRVLATWAAGDYYIDLDNINVASCFAPTAVIANSITPTAATLSWTAPSLSTPASYIYEVRSAGAVGSGTTGLATTATVTAPSTSVSVSGLTASTVYSVYVMSYCGVGSSSVWSSAGTFTTLCTPAVAPIVANSSQCGLGVSSASVSGGTTYIWYATSTSTTALQTSTTTTYATPISTTSTFYVANFNGTCLSPRVPITTTVSIPESVMASATATALCPSNSTPVMLSVTQATATVYNFTWTATPSVGSGMTAPVTTQTASVLPTAFGTYVYQVLATDGVCTTSSSVTIVSSNVPSLVVSATPSVSCSGSVLNLSATTFVLVAGTATVGTGATTSSSGGSPFYHSWGGAKVQYIYTAAELVAQGFSAGNITAMALNVTAVGIPYEGFSINAGTTTQSSFATANTINGLTQVFLGSGTNNSYLPTVGVNTFSFSSPINWNGTDNLVISICWSNATTGGTSSTVKWDTYSSNVGMYIYSDSQTPSTVCSATTTIPASGGSSITTGRPQTIFTGQIGTQGVGPVSYQWNPGAINTNTATVNPVNTGTSAVTMVYTVSATNTVTGCSNTATTSVVVNPLPTAPIASNSSQCGLAIPTASVSGGTSYVWYATNTTTTVLQTGAANHYTAAINTTTSWFVSSFNGTCESLRTMVTQSVTIPDAVTATSSASMVCPGGSYSLSAVKTGTMNTYLYTWNATPSVGSGMPAMVTGANQVVTPTTAGNYNYLVTAIDGACTATASVMVALNNPPAISASANPTMVCSGSNVMLDAQSIAGAAGTSTVGVQTTTGITGGPYRQGASTDNKAQYLFTAAELTAAGFAQGNITGLSFNVTTNGSGTMNNFTIKMASTTSNTLGTTYNAAPPVVFGPVAYTTIAGLNTHTFATPFYWNGTSNVILEVCHDIVTGASSSSYIGQQTATTNVIYSNTTGACALTTGTSGTNRAVVIFNGQLGPNVTSSMNFVWNPGAINTNTVLVNPVNTGTTAVTVTYTATVTNTVTGCSNYTTVAVVVNPLPTMPLATNAIQCGLAVPSASVSGGTSYNWYSTGTSTTALQMGATSHFNSAINVTTTWFVASFNGTCESPRVMVTQSVTIPDAIMATASATAVCPNSMVNLMAINTGTTNTYAYSWMATPSVGSGIPASVSGASVSLTPSVSGTYNYVVTGVDLGSVCTTTAAVSVIVNTVPSIVSSATPSMVCSGAMVNLSAITGSLGTVAIGTGTTTTSSSSYPTAFGNYWYQTWQQYLYTAAELNAMGLSAGNITSLAFNIAATPSPNTPLADYNVKIAATTNTTLAGFTTTGLNNVFGPAAVTAVTGVNTINLSTPYNWDGVSNLIIDLRQTEFFGSGNAKTYYTTTSNTSVVYAYSLSSDPSFWTSSPSSTGSSSRPNLTFGGVVTQNGPYAFQWNPGAINSNTATVNPVNTGTAATTMVYTVSVTNTLTTCSSSATNSVIVNPFPIVAATSASSVICANYTTTLTATGATTYSWMPVGGGSVNASVTPSATTIYTVVGTKAGCSSTATVQITTNASPTIQVVSSSTSAVCPATSVTLTTSGVATTYTWNPAISTNSMAVVSPTASSVYTVMAEDAGCVTTKTIVVAVNSTTLNIAASNTLICLGTTSGVTILASGSAVSYTWSPVVTSNTTTILAVTPTVTTNYVINGANALGCVTTKTITVNVANTPTVMITASSSAICTGNSATLTANGASSYTWDPIVSTATNVVVSPTVMSTYSVTGEANGCSSTGVVTITVNQLPIVNTSATPAVICNGQSSTLSATTTATSYTWSNGANTISTVVTPTVTGGYTLTVNDGMCKASTVITVSVSACIGIEELAANGISIYPNPTTDILNIDVNTDLVNASTVNIYDALGKLVISENVTNARTTIRTSNLDTGMYFVKITSNNREISVQKLIKQ